MKKNNKKEYYTVLDVNSKDRLDRLLVQYPLVKNIVHAIDKNKGIALLVGGAVRDILRGCPIKDLDIEVYGLSVQKFETLLQTFGVVSLVGKSFGVFRLHNLAVDWSLPRADSPGRKPTVIIDPHMSFKNAFRRRDLTINAMGINIITYELIDPFNGLCDLRKALLRVTDERFFLQDPLRFFRVMQFIARFDMKPIDALFIKTKKNGRRNKRNN